MSTDNISTQETIIIIDDEDEFRDVAVRLIQPILAQNWRIIAPTTLDEAMQRIREDIVRIALIDRCISGDGYQPLNEDGISFETTSGIQIAYWMRQTFPHIRRIAYSKGGLGCSQFNGHTQGKFPLKQHLNEEGHTGEVARKTFIEFMREQIAEVTNKTAETKS